MPAAATKGKAPANGAKGAGKKSAGEKAGSSNSKAESSSATASGAATPTTTAASESLKGDAAATATTAGGSSGKMEKPDFEKYDKEQKAIKAEIDAKQAQKSKVEEQLKAASAGGSGSEKHKALKAELEALNSNNKTSKSAIHDAMNAKKEEIEKLKKESQASRGKIPYKNIDELEAYIKQLEKQVDSATMKIADEKRTLQTITASKKFRKPLQEFETKQDQINRLQAELDDLRKQLDDPELKKAHDQADAIKAQMNEIAKTDNEYYGNIRKLRDERAALKAELDALWDRKRESSNTYHDANNRYKDKVNADRARRQEQYKAKRKEDEDEKRRAIALQMREEAESPAFQEEIEDCQTLIDFFSGKGTGVKERADPVSLKVALVGVPELELRQVETAPADGFVQFKKKGDDDDVYFAGTKGKGKGKKGSGKAKPNGSAATDAATNGDAAPSQSSDKLQVPLATLRALLKMSIPPPSSPADVTRTVEDLKTKKTWFEANQERVTKENIAKAEARIQKLSTGTEETKTASKSGTETPASDIQPPNGTGENPPEPIPTPLSTDSLSVAVESEKVDEVLDDIQQVQAEVEAES